MTTIRVDGTEIQYQDWSVTAGTSDTSLAPVATVETASRAASATGGERLAIERDDGTTVFEGDITDAPTRRDGSQKLSCEHDYFRVFGESVSLSLTSPTAEDVLRQALSASDGGASADLTYSASAVSLGGDYQVENRSVKRVFRDMADRVGAVWWVDTGDTITFNEPGGRGTWATLDATTDRFVVTKYDARDLATVVNDQTVTGTGGERVSASAEDATSISEYGRREGDPVNVSYITSASEAQEYAQQLLTPDPESAAEVVVPDGVGGDTTQILSNYLLDVSDPNGTGMNDTLVIEEQVIEEGRMTVSLGAASARGKIQVNRSAKSQEDTFEGDDLDKVAGDLDDVDDGANFARILSSAIQSGRHTLQAAVGDLDNIEDGGTFARVREGNVDSDNFVLLATSVGDLDDIDDGSNFGRVSTTAIDAGEIILAETTGDLDDIEDGTNFGKVDITNLTPGGAVFATGVELNDGRDLDEITATDADKSNATVIDGDEILTGSIQATEIDALVLDTDQLKVGFDTDTELEFVENSLGDTALRPEFDSRGYIGDPSHRFDVGYFSVLDSDSVGTDDITVNSSGANIVTVFADNGASLRPSVDNEGALGTSVAAWSTIVTHNLNELTPAPMDATDPVDGLDLQELKRSSWKRPPAYVAQRKATAQDDREYRRQNPAKEGVELGHMTNYLLETCKAQQEKIDSLEERVAALEGNA